MGDRRRERNQRSRSLLRVLASALASAWTTLGRALGAASWRRTSELAAVWGLCVLLVLTTLGVVLPAAPAQAAPTPFVTFNNFTAADGSLIRDCVNPGNTCGTSEPSAAELDIASGASSGQGALGSVFVASDGTNVMFRLRVLGNPSSSAGGFASGQWQAALATQNVSGCTAASGFCHALTIGIDGKSPSSDRVYMILPNGTRETNVYTTGSDGKVPGTRTSVDDSGVNYFVDWQVPVADIKTMMTTGGTTTYGTITATTPIRAFYGTSAAANIAVINKDYMSGDATSFEGLRTTTLNEATLSLSKSSTLVSGTNPPKATKTSVYDLTLTASNTGSNPMTNVTITDSIPSGVTLVSQSTSSGSITASGSALSWTPATPIGIGESVTGKIRVSVTPTAAQRGTNITLNDGATGSWSDANTGKSFSGATSNKVSVGPVANNPPDAVNDSGSVLKGGSVDIAVLSNDSDADDSLDPSSVAVTSGPANGTTSVNTSTGAITYTHDNSTTSSDSFTYRITDAKGATDTATVSVSVTTNSPPMVSFTSGAGAVNESTDEVTFQYSASDSDGTISGTPTTSCGLAGTKVSGSDSFSAGNGSFKCVFPDGAAGGTSSTVSVTATDNGSASSTANKSVTVSNVAPSVTISSDGAGATGVAESFTYSLSDPGDDSFPNAAADDRSISCGSDGSLSEESATASGGSFKCSYSSTGIKTVTVTAKDSDGAQGSDTESMSIAANAAPTITWDSANDYTVDEHVSSERSFFFSASDSDGLNSTISASCGSGGELVADSTTLTTTSGSGSFKCLFEDGPASPDISVTVTDALNNSTTATKAVTVANVAPTTTLAGPTSPTVGIAVTYTYTVSDPGNDTPTVTTSCGSGTKSEETSGSFKCTFSSTGQMTVSAQATDSDNATGPSATLSVTPASDNDPPSATAQSVSVLKDSSRTITLAGTDPEGSVLMYKITSLPANGTLKSGSTTITGSDLPKQLSGNEVTYVPAGGFTGSDVFNFKVNDGTADSAAAAVTLTIEAANSKPVVTSLTVAPSAPKTKDVVTAIIKTSDPDGDPVVATYAWYVNGVKKKTTTNSASLSDTYDLQPQGNGDLDNQISVKVTPYDQKSFGDFKAESVQVVNTTPAAFNRSVASPGAGATKTISLDGKDDDDQTLFRTIQSLPSVGTLADPNGSQITSVPYTLKDHGADVVFRAPTSLTATSFTYLVSDDRAGSATATVGVFIPTAPTTATVTADSTTVSSGASVSPENPVATTVTTSDSTISNLDSAGKGLDVTLQKAQPTVTINEEGYASVEIEAEIHITQYEKDSDGSKKPGTETDYVAPDLSEAFTFDFLLDSALLPADADQDDVRIFRTPEADATVEILNCDPNPPAAAGDLPCVSSRSTDGTTGDITITVITLGASLWNFVVPVTSGSEPDTTIVSGPSGAVNPSEPDDPSAPHELEFRFSSDQSPVIYSCELVRNNDGTTTIVHAIDFSDNGGTGCVSPYIYDVAGDPDDLYTFRMQAKNTTTNEVDPTPGSRDVVVDRMAPTVTVTSGPAHNSTITDNTATFTFTSDDPFATLRCKLDDGTRVSCQSGSLDYTALSDGPHQFTVEATDSASNIGNEVRDFTVDVPGAQPAPGDDDDDNGEPSPIPTGTPSESPSPEPSASPSPCEEATDDSSDGCDRADLPGPLVKLHIVPAHPYRGNTIEVRTHLNRCPGHEGTRIVLQRQIHGPFRRIAEATLDGLCRATFETKASFKRAMFKAIWPQQDDDHARGGSRRLVVETRRRPSAEKLPGPRLHLAAKPEHPLRGERMKLRAWLARCDGHRRTRVVLNVRTPHGMKRIASKRLNRRCHTAFFLEADFDRAVFKALWPKQHDDHRAGHDKAIVVTRDDRR